MATRTHTSHSSVARAVGALAAGVAAVALLAGCMALPDAGDLDQIVEEAVEQATEGDAGGDSADEVADDMGTVAIPASWPAEVPVPDAPILSASETQGSSMVISALFDTREQAEAYLEQLKSAGFVATVEQSHEGAGTAQLEGSGWQITYSYQLDSDDNYYSQVILIEL